MALTPASATPTSSAAHLVGATGPTRTMAPARRSGLPILTATLAETRIGTAIACFYIAAIILLVGALAPTLKSVNLGAYLSSPVGQALIGSKVGAAALRTFTGYLSVEFYSVWFGLFFGGFLAFISGGIVARPVEDGTIELALARPFSRRRFYLERCGALLVVGLIMSVWALAAVWVDTSIFTGVQVDWHWLLLTQLAGGAFLAFTLGLGAVISAFSNVARTAGSVAIGVLVLGYLLNSLAGLSDRLTWMTYLSPFHYAQLSAILVQHQITWWHLVLLTGLGVAGVIAGLIVFERRDLAP
jgi:ABC-2 type transport system permease protein